MRIMNLTELPPPPHLNLPGAILQETKVAGRVKTKRDKEKGRRKRKVNPGMAAETVEVVKVAKAVEGLGNHAVEKPRHLRHPIR